MSTGKAPKACPARRRSCIPSEPWSLLAQEQVIKHRVAIQSSSVRMFQASWPWHSCRSMPPKGSQRPHNASIKKRKPAWLMKALANSAEVAVPGIFSRTERPQLRPKGRPKIHVRAVSLDLLRQLAVLHSLRLISVRPSEVF